MDSSQTTQLFPDYTLRESEIANKTDPAVKSVPGALPHLPKRLRGVVYQLVKRLQKLHSRCPYYEFLNHYCPSRTRRSHLGASQLPKLTQKPAYSSIKPDAELARSSTGSQTTQIQTCTGQDASSHDNSRLIKEVPQTETPIVDHATPASSVSAFCRAVLDKLVPRAFWGLGIGGDHNHKTIMHAVDQFVQLRRFENFTLHAISQNLKVARNAILNERILNM